MLEMHSTLSCGHVGDNYTLTTQKWHAKVLAVADASSTFRYILVSRVHKKASKAYLVVNFEIRKSRYSNRKLDKRHSAYWLLTALFARDTYHTYFLMIRYVCRHFKEGKIEFIFIQVRCIFCKIMSGQHILNFPYAVSIRMCITRYLHMYVPLYLLTKEHAYVRTYVRTYVCT